MSEQDLRQQGSPEGASTETGAGAQQAPLSMFENVPPAALQRRIQRRAAQRKVDGGSEPSAAEMHRAADDGISGSGGALPHQETIQRSFGNHDVSGIRAHTDGAAAAASRAMGAEAYATGNHVAFADTPSLHTAAHEAAHVVQQASGVHLSGGVGQEGDPYEQHADAVADAVVRGDSAQHLLDTPVGGGGAGGVQHKLQLKTADAHGGISDGKTTLEDFNGGAAVGATAKGKAGLAQATENNMSLSDQAKSLHTAHARTDKEMLAAIAAGQMPRFVARVNSRDAFTSRNTFGDSRREFTFATEPADLRGCKPGAALVKVGWVKAWLKDKIGKEIVACILDTAKAVPTTTGDKKMTVGHMGWPEIIAKAMGDAKFKREAQAAGVKDDHELQQVLDICKATPVHAQPRTPDAKLSEKASKVRKLLESNYGANDLYTGMGATMNTEGQLGVREVMVMNNDTGLKLTPDNHVLEPLGTFTQAEFDSLPS